MNAMQRNATQRNATQRNASFFLVLWLTACSADETTESVDVDPGLAARVTSQALETSYTPLSKAEWEEATRPIWENPQYTHLKPNIDEIKAAAMAKRKDPLPTPAYVPDFEAEWAPTAATLQAQGADAKDLADARAHAKEEFFLRYEGGAQ